MTVAPAISADPTTVPQETAEPGRWRRMPTKAKVGAVLMGLFVLTAIIGPLVTPYDPSYQNPSPAASMNPPSAAHLLGTTQSGQDGCPSSWSGSGSPWSSGSSSDWWPR